MLFARARGSRRTRLDVDQVSTMIFVRITAWVSRSDPEDGGLLGLTSKETPRSARVSAGGKVVPDPKSEQFDPIRARYGMQRWTTIPAAGLIQGDTLILADSFGYYGLGTLRPLIADGTFIWAGSKKTPEKDVIAEVIAADTVILEIVQRNLGPGHPLLLPEFQRKLAAALGVRTD